MEIKNLQCFATVEEVWWKIYIEFAEEIMRKSLIENFHLIIEVFNEFYAVLRFISFFFCIDMKDCDLVWNEVEKHMQPLSVQQT